MFNWMIFSKENSHSPGILLIKIVKQSIIILHSTVVSALMYQPQQGPVVLIFSYLLTQECATSLFMVYVVLVKQKIQPVTQSW